MQFWVEITNIYQDRYILQEGSHNFHGQRDWFLKWRSSHQSRLSAILQSVELRWENEDKGLWTEAQLERTPILLSRSKSGTIEYF